LTFLPFAEGVVAMDKIVLACFSVEPFAKRQKMFELLASKVNDTDVALVKLLCKQVAHPDKFDNPALAVDLLQRLNKDLVLSFLCSHECDDDAFAWVFSSLHLPLRVSVAPTSEVWPASISCSSTLNDALFWLACGVDLVLDNAVNFDRSFLAVQTLVYQKLSTSEEAVVSCLRRIFEILSSSTSSSNSTSGLSVALSCDVLVAAAPVACTEVILMLDELKIAHLITGGSNENF
jgi:hypothetical protein